MTRSKTSAYGGDPNPTSQPALHVDWPPLQYPITFDVPPLPGVLSPASSPLEGSPSLLGSMASVDGFQRVSREQGLCTTPLHNAIQTPPNPTPVAIVDHNPSGFDLDDALSDDGVRDNTLSTGTPATSANEGNPAPPADPSIQAVLDSTWPRFDVPGAPVDAAMVRLWEFVSKSSKKLDSALHSFCQD